MAKHKYIEINWEKGKISAGMYTTQSWKPIPYQTYSYTKGRNKPAWEEFVCKVIGEDLHFDIFPKYPSPKDRYQYYTKKLGCRPVQFVKMWNACNVKAFIDNDVYHIAKDFCKGRLGRYSSRDITYLHRIKDLVLQLEKDNMYHLIPLFIMKAYKKDLSVSSLREDFGKSVWKKVCKNTKTRNKLLASLGDFRDSRVEAYIDYPSSVLPYLKQNDISESVVEIAKKSKILTKRDQVIKLNSTIRDAERMEEQLCITKRPKGHTKWSIEDYENYHDILTEKIRLKQYSKDKFDWVLNLSKKVNSENTSLKDYPFEATFLDNAYDIKTEGDEQKHCVGSYANSVKEKNYLVVSIKDPSGKRISTLGVYIRKHPEKDHLKASFSQHYGKCNSSITDIELKAFAASIIYNVNNYLEGKLL